MVSHICLLVELGPICNSTAASLCLKSCVDHSLLKSYNGGLWKNIYRSGPNSTTGEFVKNDSHTNSQKGSKLNGRAYSNESRDFSGLFSFTFLS